MFHPCGTHRTLCSWAAHAIRQASVSPPHLVQSGCTMSTPRFAMVQRQRPESVVTKLEGLAARPDMLGALAGVGCPTMVVVGAEDAATPVDDARTLAETIPGARLEIFAGVGHMSNWEAPDRFTEVLLDFLRAQ